MAFPPSSLFGFSVKKREERTHLVTMLVDINRRESLEAEQKVANAGAENDAQAEPRVVGHEDEHEQVADCQLCHVQERLREVASIEQARPKRSKNFII
jgi:hypothetical protein